MLTPLIGLGWTEVLVVAGVVFVLFGASRIPTMFRSLGEGINSFKEGLEGKKDEAQAPTATKALPPAETSEAEGSSSEKS